MLHQIIYTSAAAPGFTAADFRQIAIRAAVQNKAQDITGILLFADGGILQVLEGDHAVLSDLIARISKDTRHTGLNILINRSAARREFSNWSMGFRMMSDTDALDFAFDINNTSLNAQMPDDVSPEVSVLTRTYARVHGL